MMKKGKVILSELSQITPGKIVLVIDDKHPTSTKKWKMGIVDPQLLEEYKKNWEEGKDNKVWISPSGQSEEELINKEVSVSQLRNIRVRYVWKEEGKADKECFVLLKYSQWIPSIRNSEVETGKTVIFTVEKKLRENAKTSFKVASIVSQGRQLFITVGKLAKQIGDILDTPVQELDDSAAIVAIENLLIEYNLYSPKVKS